MTMNVLYADQFFHQGKMLGRGTNTIVYPDLKDDNWVYVYTLDAFKVEYWRRELDISDGYDTINSLNELALYKIHAKKLQPIVYRSDVYKQYYPKFIELNKLTDKVWSNVVYDRKYSNNLLAMMRKYNFQVWSEIVNRLDEFLFLTPLIESIANWWGYENIVPDLIIQDCMLDGNILLPVDCAKHIDIHMFIRKKLNKERW